MDYETGAEEERAALSYFGLDDGSIETTLDHISEQAETIHSLDAIIERVTVRTDRIITPPASRPTLTTPGTRKLKPSQHPPRLKTLLFVASKVFDIDLEDQEQCKVIEGKVDPEAMREVSYAIT